MSRYLILVILNTPFVIAGLFNSLVKFKLSKISKRRFFYQSTIWLGIFVALLLAQPIYEFLFSNQLTESEPLSLFDVVQITGIVALLFVAHRTREKVEALEQRNQDLHQALSIKLSEFDKKHIK